MQVQDIFSKERYRNIGRTIGRAASSKVIAEYIVPIILSFFLSRGIMLDSLAPFGAAIFSVFARRRLCALSLGASLLGYLTIADKLPIYRYAAAAGIIFIIATAIGRRKVPFYTMPLVAGGSVFLPGAVFWALLDMSMGSFFLLFAECAAIAAMSYIFRAGMTSLRRIKRLRECDIRLTGCLMILLSAFFFSVMGDEPLSVLASHFFIAAIMLSLTVSGAYQHGVIFGLSAGVFMSLASRDMAGMCVVYGMGAVICALFSKIKKSAGIFSWLLFAMGNMSYFFGTYASMDAKAGVVAASVAVLFLPKEAGRRIRAVFAYQGKSTENHDRRMRELICDRLWRLGEGYRDVCGAVTLASEKLFKPNTGNISSVFEMAHRRACRSCELVNHCWGKEYQSTMDVMNNVTNELIKKKLVYPEDFVPHFRASCIHINEFTDAVNDSYRDFIMRRKLAGKQKQTRRLTLEQCSSLARMMECLAREFSEEITFNTAAEEKIIAFLMQLGVRPKSVIVMERPGGRVSAELDFFESEPLCMEKEKLIREVSGVCGAAMTCMNVKRYDGIMRVTLDVPSPLRPIYGSFKTTRAGERDSGDTLDAFFTPRGKLVLQLCDGMGSGRRAALDSNIAVGVIRKIIEAGFDNDTAIALLNSAMLLKSEEESVTGIDLSVIDLYTGRCELLKLGAAPTYIVHNGRVTRIESSSPPIGILDEARISKSVAQLTKGDIVVMVSDGVISSGDEYLCEMLERNSIFDPDMLSGEIVRAARTLSCGSGDDDMSVLVCMI